MDINIIVFVSLANRINWNIKIHGYKWNHYESFLCSIIYYPPLGNLVVSKTLSLDHRGIECMPAWDIPINVYCPVHTCMQQLQTLFTFIHIKAQYWWVSSCTNDFAHSSVIEGTNEARMSQWISSEESLFIYVPYKYIMISPRLIPELVLDMYVRMVEGYMVEYGIYIYIYTSRSRQC